MIESESDREIRHALERLCAVEIPKYQKDEYYNTLPRKLFESFATVGVTGLSISESSGGMAASSSTSALVMETIARFDLGPAIFISVHSMVSGLISKFCGNGECKKYLPDLASGKLLAAFALTEPQAGSDASALTTEATVSGDSFVLNGQKCYITSAGFADLYLVFARTKTDTGEGVSAFVVPADTKGLTIGKAEKKMGCELSPIASLFFESAKIPKSALLGEIHQGYKIALSGLAGGRVNIAACANGLSMTAIDLALKHTKERKQFGKPIIEFQGLQFMLADMQIALEAARALTWKSAQEIDAPASSGFNTRLSSSVAKCFATDAAMQITTDAVQLLGGAGYIKDYSVERLMRDAKMLQIVEGTNQIQRMVICRELEKR